jgi:hypothetical protein
MNYIQLTILCDVTRRSFIECTNVWEKSAASILMVEKSPRYDVNDPNLDTHFRENLKYHINSTNSLNFWEDTNIKINRKSHKKGNLQIHLVGIATVYELDDRGVEFEPR